MSRRLKTLLYSFLLLFAPRRFRRWLILSAQNAWIPWHTKEYGWYLLWLGDRKKERKWREAFLFK